MEKALYRNALHDTLKPITLSKLWDMRYSFVNLHISLKYFYNEILLLILWILFFTLTNIKQIINNFILNIYIFNVTMCFRIIQDDVLTTNFYFFMVLKVYGDRFHLLITWETVLYRMRLSNVRYKESHNVEPNFVSRPVDSHIVIRIYWQK